MQGVESRSSKFSDEQGVVLNKEVWESTQRTGHYQELHNYAEVLRRRELVILFVYATSATAHRKSE